MTNPRDQDGLSAPAAASTAPPRGTADVGEEPQLFPEAFAACDGEAVQGWIGRRFTVASEAALLEASGAVALRTAAPGQVLAMDYRTDRLTIELDRADVIIALRCG